MTKYKIAAANNEVLTCQKVEWKINSISVRRNSSLHLGLYLIKEELDGENKN